MTKSTTPQVEMIAPVDLKIDGRTQRPFDEAHANRIARTFDPSLVGLLEVSRRPDGFYLIDGQHRTAAAIKAGRGDTPMPCYVVDGLSIAQEGHRFVGINSTVKKPHIIDLFRIRVVAEDPAAVEIDQILSAAGLQVAVSNNDGTISAIAAAEAVYYGRGTTKLGEPNPELLIDTLSVLGEAWGKSRDAYDATILKAMGVLLGKHGGRIDKDRLAHLLAKSGTAAQLIGRARSLGDATRKSAPAAAVQVMIEIYNHSLRSGRIKESA